MSAAPDAEHEWHARAREDVLRELGADEAGLTAEEASERLRRYGPNRLPRGRGARPPRRCSSARCASPLMYALIAAAALAMAMGELEDGARRRSPSSC